MKNAEKTLKNCIKISMIMMFFLCLFTARNFAEDWPGFLKDGARINSSPHNISELKIKWVYKIDSQNPQIYWLNRLAGSHRSKNICIRDGQIALIIPEDSIQHIGFINAETGELIRSFATDLGMTGIAEFNHVGIEGRDMRNGQYLMYWHKNGFIYARSSGDGCMYSAFKVSDGIQQEFGWEEEEYNQAGYFVMNDNCNWQICTNGGHQGATYGLYMSHTSGDFEGRISVGHYKNNGYLFTWGGPLLLDSNWLYTLGPTNHPDLGFAGYTVDPNRRQWLGINLHGYKITGQDATEEDKTCALEFNWREVDGFIANDGDLCSYPKPLCLGKNEIYLVSQGGVSHTETDASVDFSRPLILHGINRYNGEHWQMDLGINAAGAFMSKSFSYYSSYHTFFPQIAYTDQSETGGNELVAVMLPEALRNSGWHIPKFDPYNTNILFNTRISVIDVNSKSEVWNYEYERNATTPLWNFGCNANTKMVISGNALYVAYVKTDSLLSNYIDTINSYPLNLFIDRFLLSDGTKTSYTCDLGVNANTLQVDDLAAVDGRLYALVTYREALTGGGQLAACIGGSAVHVADSYNTTSRTLIKAFPNPFSRGTDINIMTA
ncbi:MAG: hypothetical protein ABIA63_12135, partial [bacterium]